MTHYLHFSQWTKRAFLLGCLLTLSVGSLWAQTTQIYVTGTQIYSTKVYDGTTLSGVYNVGTLSGINVAHNVLVTADANYIDCHVGTLKPVVVTYSIQGPDAYRYIAPATDTLYADITARPLTISGTRIANKVYDGTTNASVHTFGTLDNIAEADLGHVFPTINATFLNPSAGTFRPAVVVYGVVCAGGAGLATDYVAPATDTLVATIEALTLYAQNVRTATTKVYDGTTSCPVLNVGQISGALPGDTLTYSCIANFNNANVGIMKPVTVSYLCSGAQGANYSIVDTNLHIGSITSRALEYTAPEVQLIKEYDSTTAAIILTPASPTNIVEGDNVLLVTLANYDTPEVGDNKTITATFAIFGNDASNYQAPADYIVSTEGRIILPTQLDTLPSGQMMQATAVGFCQGTNAGLAYRISQGDPIMYRIIFDADAIAQGFENTGWVNCTATDSVIFFPVPAGCAEGDYSLQINFVNGAHVISYPIHATFHVHIPNTYLVQAFDDVVSLDNTTNRFFDGYSQWYRNGEALEGSKLYYQELGGLNGEYSVRVNVGTAQEGYVCPKTFTTDSRVSVIHVYPSPVVSSTSIRLQGFKDCEHQLQLFNSYGALVFSTTFSGIDYKLDLSTMPQGSYMINIDGRTAKTIKL